MCRRRPPDNVDLQLITGDLLRTADSHPHLERRTPTAAVAWLARTPEGPWIGTNPQPRCSRQSSPPTRNAALPQPQITQPGPCRYTKDRFWILQAPAVRAPHGAADRTNQERRPNRPGPTPPARPAIPEARRPTGRRGRNRPQPGATPPAPTPSGAGQWRCGPPAFDAVEPPRPNGGCPDTVQQSVGPHRHALRQRMDNARNHLTRIPTTPRERLPPSATKPTGASHPKRAATAQRSPRRPHQSVADTATTN